MYSIAYTQRTYSTIHAAARLPAPNRHIHSHGHHRTQQKSG